MSSPIRSAAPDDDETGTPEERIVREAKRRFLRCEQWESTVRELFLADLKFCNGDSDNGFQWPDDIRSGREAQQRPCLTINKTEQHCFQIENDARQNKPSITVVAVGDGASAEAADVFEGVIRHVEYISNAQAAYDTATRFQVEGGIGYWRIVTGYRDDDSFDQEIFIRRVRDPLTVYLDPDTREGDASDARFGFIFDDVPKDEFEQRYPKYKKMVPPKAALGNGDGWIDKDHVRVAEYYRRVERPDQLVALKDGSVHRASEIPTGLRQQMLADPENQVRDIITHEVEHFVIVGEEIAEKEIWPGSTIPIVPVKGKELIIDGKLYRKGHVRALKDPQRMYNFWTSSAAEHVALQSKSPYIGPMGAFEGLEPYWNSANKVDHAWLPFNAYDDKGQSMPAPARQQPPVMAQAYIDGMKIAATEMMMVSGQYEANFGQKSNERSGKAINERQRQGDNATYHFIDHLAQAIRRTGKILIELIPIVYDTPRVLRILAKDGESSHVMLDPKAKNAYEERQKATQGAVDRIFNPNVGRYDVEADIGPAYATQRQEAFNALSQLAAQNQEVMKVAGDLVFKAADFPMADELAERLRRTIDPAILGEAPPPVVQQLQQKLQAVSGLLQQTMDQLATEKQKSGAKDADAASDAARVEVDRYNAETNRLKVMAPTIDAQQVAQISAQLVMDALATHLAANDQPPVQGARKAGDGHWYVDDPQRPGKYLMVAA